MSEKGIKENEEGELSDELLGFVDESTADFTVQGDEVALPPYIHVHESVVQACTVVGCDKCSFTEQVSHASQISMNAIDWLERMDHDCDDH